MLCPSLNGKKKSVSAILEVRQVAKYPIFVQRAGKRYHKRYFPSAFTETVVERISGLIMMKLVRKTPLIRTLSLRPLLLLFLATCCWSLYLDYQYNVQFIWRYLCQEVNTNHVVDKGGFVDCTIEPNNFGIEVGRVRNWRAGDD